jgi:hypothetical protein
MFMVWQLALKAMVAMLGFSRTAVSRPLQVQEKVAIAREGRAHYLFYHETVDELLKKSK